jgi:hypothetical protein
MLLVAKKNVHNVVRLRFLDCQLAIQKRFGSSHEGHNGTQRLSPLLDMKNMRHTETEMPSLSSASTQPVLWLPTLPRYTGYS